MRFKNYLDQFMLYNLVIQSGPCTRNISITWESVRNAKIPGATPDLLSQNLHLINPHVIFNHIQT